MPPISLDEELERAAEEQNKADELERLKQEQRKKNLDRVRKLSRAGQIAAALSGNEELYNFLGEGANTAKDNAQDEQQPGAIRNAASNVGGKAAGYAGKKYGGLSKGKGAALGGAVAGALEGEGATGIAKSAISWWVLDLVFGSLFTIVLFIPALLYLDLHFILHKMGSKLFGAMNLWQKLLLVIANLIAVLIPMIAVLFIYVATCGNSFGSTLSTVAHYGSLGYVQDFCAAFQGGGGASGGGGGGGSFANNDQAVRDYLAAAPHGITVNKADCTSVGQTNCTSLDGMQQATVNEIVAVAQACDARANPAGPPDNACGIEVTGGTEAGHEAGACSHATGNKVDLSASSQLNSYITNPNIFNRILPNRSDGAPLYQLKGGGAIYADERNIPGGGPHWDVAVGCA